MDKRKNRIQPIRLLPNYFPLDIHKSMFINDLMITIPKYYAETWGEDVLDRHDASNFKWNVDINYEGPKDSGKLNYKFKCVLSLFFAKNRSKSSSYRLKWDNKFAVQLAKDYPKSFVRSLEFHIGDEYYKEKRFTEYDIGGFKEQLQVRISWEDGIPQIYIKEYFRVKEESQDFPNIYRELSSYLIADYLLSDEKEILRRIQVSKWKKRPLMKRELNENNIYVLLNRKRRELYFGETGKSMSMRYPEKELHHSFNDWDEYCIVQLPPETSEHTRLLIERVLITIGTKLFDNNLDFDKPVFVGADLFKLMNRKK